MIIEDGSLVVVQIKTGQGFYGRVQFYGPGEHTITRASGTRAVGESWAVELIPTGLSLPGVEEKGGLLPWGPMLFPGSSILSIVAVPDNMSGGQPRLVS